MQQVTVVAPTEHLKHQWAEAAKKVGIGIDPKYAGAGGGTSRDYQGIAVTYAGVAAHPMLHRRRVEGRKTLVILDEIHHAGDSQVLGRGDLRGLRARRPPPGPDRHAVPLGHQPDPVRHLRPGQRRHPPQRRRLHYGYGSALADGVVRPVVFMSYAGRMRWRTKAGDEIASSSTSR